MGRTGLAVGGVTLIGVGVAFGLGWFWPATGSQTAEIGTHISSVEIDNGSGDVTIRAGDVEQTVVRQSFQYRWSEPAEAYSVHGTTLALHGCGSSCRVDYDVVVPRGTTVSGDVTSGDVVLDGVDDVRMNTASGDLTLRLDQVRTVSVEASSGDIDVTVAAGAYHTPAAAAEQVLDLSASSGDIDVRLPAGAYRLDIATASGDRDIGVPHDPGSTRVLDVSTSSGDVTVQRDR